MPDLMSGPLPVYRIRLTGEQWKIAADELYRAGSALGRPDLFEALLMWCREIDRCLSADSHLVAVTWPLPGTWLQIFETGLHGDAEDIGHLVRRQTARQNAAHANRIRKESRL